MISLIVARDRNGAIGKGNDIPWHLPADLQFFMRETLGGAVIMGRNTWDSLPVVAKPLKNRLNIVVSSQGVEHDHVVSTIEEAVALARTQGRARIYGMGGAGIYKAMLPLADRLLITEVDLAVEGADTWFPSFDESEWRVSDRIALSDAASEGGGASAPSCEVVERIRVSNWQR
ncbi:dihydrofolate reductase [Celeribacter sp.]|uniref:dihydrofolate reductase n=1 Tax=Celeribacter sp. TaxID=1890673 RepID=UPI003A909C70